MKVFAKAQKTPVQISHKQNWLNSEYKLSVNCWNNLFWRADSSAIHQVDSDKEGHYIKQIEELCIKASNYFLKNIK